MSEQARHSASEPENLKSSASGDAASASPNSGNGSKKNDQIRWRDIVEGLIWAMLVGMILKIFVMDIFSVPSKSMQPTLHVGDFVVVNKLAYSFGLPRTLPFSDWENPLHWTFDTGELAHDDVIVFDFPAYGETEAELERYVKRVWALPGDKIEFKNTSLYNFTTNQSVELPPKSGVRRNLAEQMHLALPDRSASSQLVVPFNGMQLSLDATNIDAWRELIISEGNRVNLSEGKVYINGECCDSYTIASDYVFVVGDNHDNSYDSRFWGCVARQRVLGKAVLVYWSRKSSGDIDFGRIGTLVD